MSALQSLKAASAKKKTLAEELKTEEKAAAEAAPVEEEAAAEAPEETTEEAVEIDPATLTAKQLDELVEQYGIEVPAEWKKWKKDQKVEWLQAQFAEAPDEAPEEPDTNEALPEAPVAEAVEEPEALAEPKAKKGKAAPKGKGSAVAISTTKTGEVLSPDEFSNTVSEIENLKAKDALDLVDKLSDASDFTLFKLGGVLSRIHEDGWYKELKFSTFREYVEQRHALGYRKAMYWIAIYKDLVSSGVPYAAVSSVKWSKLKEIASVINNDNVDEWVQAANENTIDNLIKLVSNYKKSGSEEVAGQLSTTAEGVISTMAFKVHTDQKENIQAALDKAKAEAKTDVNTVALEYICIAFNSGATAKGKAKVPPIKDQLAGMDLETAAQALIDAFPDFTINISVEAPEGEEEAA